MISAEKEHSLREMLTGDRFAAGAGVELIEVDEGYAKARMLVTGNHLNAGGVCQGGALFTLADFAFAAAANGRTNVTLTLNAQVTFLKAVKEGFVYAEAREVFNHSRVPFFEIRLTDADGELVAFLTSSGYRKRQEWPF